VPVLDAECHINNPPLSGGTRFKEKILFSFYILLEITQNSFIFVSIQKKSDEMK